MTEHADPDHTSLDVRALDDAHLSEDEAVLARTHADLQRAVVLHLGSIHGDRGDRLRPRRPERTLVHHLAEALTSAGLAVHDSDANAPAGGVCLTPLTPGPGVVVTWTTHDALCLSRHRDAEDRRVHAVMNRAVADVLVAMGWPVTPHGDGGASCVTSPPHQAPAVATQFDIRDGR